MKLFLGFLNLLKNKVKTMIFHDLFNSDVVILNLIQDLGFLVLALSQLLSFFDIHS